jgi:hypothetical protein
MLEHVPDRRLGHAQLLGELLAGLEASALLLPGFDIRTPSQDQFHLLISQEARAAHAAFHGGLRVAQATCLQAPPVIDPSATHFEKIAAKCMANAGSVRTDSLFRSQSRRRVTDSRMLSFFCR